MIEIDKDAERYLQIRCTVNLKKLVSKNDQVNDPHLARLIHDEILVLNSYASLL